MVAAGALVEVLAEHVAALEPAGAVVDVPLDHLAPLGLGVGPGFGEHAGDEQRGQRHDDDERGVEVGEEEVEPGADGDQRDERGGHPGDEPEGRRMTPVRRGPPGADAQQELAMVTEQVGRLGRHRRLHYHLRMTTRHIKDPMWRSVRTSAF
ncbi:hypothetical protein ACFSTC_30325 [Nonomuraea ferruginea]